MDSTLKLVAISVLDDLENEQCEDDEGDEGNNSNDDSDEKEVEVKQEHPFNEKQPSNESFNENEVRLADNSVEECLISHENDPFSGYASQNDAMRQANDRHFSAQLNEAKLTSLLGYKPVGYSPDEISDFLRALNNSQD